MVALTIVNALIMTVILVKPQVTEAQAKPGILRGTGMEIVDQNGKKRATIELLPANPTAKMPDGSVGTTETVILRPSHILGTVRNAPSNYLRMKRVPTLLGFDPMMQVVHQDDVVSAIVRALSPGARGIFNISGPPPVALSQAIELLGRQTVPLPHGLARVAVDRLFRWRVTSFPAAELDFIRYVCMVDDSRARRELCYAPRHDLGATLSAVDEERWVD
jgi:hypothetical protein